MPPALHAQPVSRPCRFLSVNANGLASSPAKRRTLLGAFIRGPWDVLCVQEAHTVSSQEAAAWAQEGAGLGMPLQGGSFANPLSARSAGVVTFTKAIAPVTASRQVAAPAGGRLLDVALTYAGVEVSLLNCYAPCEGGARPGFFSGAFAETVPADRPVLACGDWNFVQSAQDVVGPVGGRSVGAREFETVQVERGLVDAWRHLHPSGAGVTFLAAGGSSARLDRWYVSAQLLPWVQRCEVVLGLPGDHLGVELTLAPPATLPCGKGRWRLPLHLLDDAQFCAGVQERGASYLAEHPLQPGFDARQRWDGLKAALTHHCMAFDLQTRRAASQQRRQLLAAAAAAQRAYSLHPAVPGLLQAFQQTQRAVQEYDAEAAEKRAAAASVLWHCYGERPTKWFHQLGRTVLPHQPLPAVRDPEQPEAPAADLSTRAGVQEGLRRATAFFSADSPVGLFRPAPTDPAAQAELLAAVDSSLSPAQAAATLGPAGDGTFEAGGVAAVFPSLPRGVSPGLDGLPYEFYMQFWDLLGGPFVAMANGALAAAGGGAVEAAPDAGVLPPSMLVGLIVLLYKGGDKAVADLASYRPITLLNCDYRLLARALCSRFAGPLSAIVDPTQTAFLPGRWIGDNVLYHLEEVQYLQEQEAVEGCVVFLDFEKAYDRVVRGWLYQVMGRMGFPEPAVRWARLMLAGTSARVSLNGHYTAPFPVRSSVQQGSPLSTLLFTIVVQPLAAHLRRMVATGAVQPILLPDGSPAPPSQQHADDTSLHLRRPADVAVVLGPAGSVGLHCGASGAALSRPKLKGWRRNFSGVCPVCGVTFPPPQEPIRHLGIFLGADPVAANTRTFGRLHAAVLQAALLWRQHKLSWLGRSYIAKQVLGAMLSYHACFVPCPADLWARLQRILSSFVRGSTPEDGLGGPSLCHPRLAVTALPWEEGGVGMLDLGVQGACLQAKVAARLLHPARHPWKLLLRERLRRAFPALGPAVLFAAVSDGSIRHALDARCAAYVLGFRAARPHRVLPPEALSGYQARTERLFHNHQIRRLATDQPFEPSAALLTVGVFTVGQLADLSAAGPLPRELQRVWDRVPGAWQQRAMQPQPAQEPLLAPGGGWVQLLTGETQRVLPDGSLAPLEEGGAAPPPPGPGWEPCCVAHCPTPAALRRLAREEARAAAAGEEVAAVAAPPGQQQRAPPPVPFLVGPWRTVQVDPHVWGAGTKNVLHYTVKATALRRVRLQAAAIEPAQSHAWYVPGVGIYPPLWPSMQSMPAAVQARQGLAAHEQRWQDSAAGRAQQGGGGLIRQEPEGGWWVVGGEQPSQRSQRSEGGRGPPLVRFSTLDVQDACAKPEGFDEATASAVRAAWSRLREADLPREQFGTAYRVLHASLFVGGYACHCQLVPAADACCTHPACGGQLETLSHAFLACPAVAAAASWVCAVVGAAAGCPPPPPSPSTLLLARWQPDDEEAEPLWTALRSAFLHSVWLLRCRRSLADAPFSPRSVCAAVVAAIRSSIRRDWMRVTKPLVHLSGAPPEWFKGRDPQLTRSAFERRWVGTEAALCRVTGPAGALHIDLLFSLQHPVPAPAQPPPAAAA